MASVETADPIYFRLIVIFSFVISWQSIFNQTSKWTSCFALFYVRPISGQTIFAKKMCNPVTWLFHELYQHLKCSIKFNQGHQYFTRLVIFVNQNIRDGSRTNYQKLYIFWKHKHTHIYNIYMYIYILYNIGWLTVWYRLYWTKKARLDEAQPSPI